MVYHQNKKPLDRHKHEEHQFLVAINYIDEFSGHHKVILVTRNLLHALMGPPQCNLDGLINAIMPCWIEGDSIINTMLLNITVTLFILTRNTYSENSGHQKTILVRRNCITVILPPQKTHLVTIDWPGSMFQVLSFLKILQF